MTPYHPPNAHYSQMDVSEYDQDKVFSFIGKTGKKFYWLTKKLELDYLWYDKERKVIEIWGPYHTHMNISDDENTYTTGYIRLVLFGRNRTFLHLEIRMQKHCTKTLQSLYYE